MMSGMPDMSMPMGMQQTSAGFSPPATPSVSTAAPERPQTSAYALCDSPSGLLAYVYDAIRPETASSMSTSSSLSPEHQRRLSTASTATSPLSPQSYAQSFTASTPASRSGRSTAGNSPVATRSPPKLISQSSSGSGGSSSNPGLSPEKSDPQHLSPWPPAAIIDWTMLHWLPGPEVMLRWLVNSQALMPTYWASHSLVPLGISHFRDPAPGGNGEGTGKAPPQWSEAYHRVAMVRRREGRVRFPAWEVPGEVVGDLREFVGLLGVFGQGVGMGR